jgi:integrase
VPKLSLSDLKIRQLKPGEYWDANFPAFGIRVGVNTKTFLLKKNNSRIKLGALPTTSTLTGSVEGPRPQVRCRTSPRPRNHPQRRDRPLRRQHCKSYRPRSLAEITRLLGKLRPLENKKLSATSFRFCVRRRIGPNPLDGLSVPNKERSRARVLTDAELKSIWHACEQSGGGCVVRLPPETMDSSAARLVEHPRLPASFCTIVQLLILTGQRRGEIAALQSSWIKDNKITLPKEVAKNGRQHTFPIGIYASQLLNSVIASNARVLFPARGSDVKPFNGWSKSKAALDQASGVKNWTLHDLRRTVASNMGALGIRLEVIERILNHVSGSFGVLRARTSGTNSCPRCVKPWKNGKAGLGL